MGKQLQELGLGLPLHVLEALTNKYPEVADIAGTLQADPYSVLGGLSGDSFMCVLGGRDCFTNPHRATPTDHLRHQAHHCHHYCHLTHQCHHALLPPLVHHHHA